MAKDATKDQTPRAGTPSPEKDQRKKQINAEPMGSRAGKGIPFMMGGVVLGGLLMFLCMTLIAPREPCDVQTLNCQAEHLDSQRTVAELTQKLSKAQENSTVCESAKSKNETTIKELEEKVRGLEKDGKSCKAHGDSGLEEKLANALAENDEVKAYMSKISEEHKKAVETKKSAEEATQKCGEQYKAITSEMEKMRQDHQKLEKDNSASVKKLQEEVAGAKKAGAGADGTIAPAILARSAIEQLAKCENGYGPGCPSKDAVYTITWGMTNLRASLAAMTPKDPTWFDYIDRVLGDCASVQKLLEAGQQLDMNNFKILYTNARDLFTHLMPISVNAMKLSQKTPPLVGQFCKNPQCAVA